MPPVGWRWPIGRIGRGRVRIRDPAVEVRLVELRGLHPGWGADRLRSRLGREGVDPLPRLWQWGAQVAESTNGR